MRRGRVGVAVACAIAIGLLGAPATGAGAAVPPVVTVPTSIATDCSRNVTTEILAWIASVPDGSTLQFGPNACYRVDGTLRVRYRHNLTFEGNHATFRAFTDGSELGSAWNIRTRSMWNFADSTNLTLRNTVVIGANPNAGRGDLAYRAIYEAQHAYLIQNTQTALLDHVEAYDVYGDFVYVGSNSSDVTVRNSTFSRNGRQGWTINGTNVLFENNSISETRRATIDMEPALPGWVARNITIRNNTIGKGRLYFFASVGAAATIDNVNVIGNHLIGKSMRMYVDPPKGTRSHYRIIGNTSDTPLSQAGGAALGFRDIVYLEVRGNTVPIQGGRGISGVSIENCAHVQVTDNTFFKAVGPIFDLGLSVDIQQSGNQIGNPLRLAAATTVVGPTPLFVR
jgi:hypothetical protein